MITCFGQDYRFGESSSCWLSSFGDDRYSADVYVATEAYDNPGPSIAELRQELWTKLERERRRDGRNLIFFEVFNPFSWPIRKHDGYQGIRQIRLLDGKYIAEEPSHEWKSTMEGHVAETVEGSIWHNVVRDRYLKEFREDGKKVRAARKSLGLSQKEFAEKLKSSEPGLKISSKTIARIERGETETKVRIMRLVESLIAPEPKQPIQYRFTYQRLDLLAERDAIFFGQEWPERECDSCKKSFPAKDSYCLTPIDFGPWLAESKSLETWKAFGPNRCKHCLPPEAIEAGAFHMYKKRSDTKPTKEDSHGHL